MTDAIYLLQTSFEDSLQQSAAELRLLLISALAYVKVLRHSCRVCVDGLRNSCSATTREGLRCWLYGCLRKLTRIPAVLLQRSALKSNG
eukprot:3204633-Amphidinium_carterae.2